MGEIPMFARELTNAGHVRRFTIEQDNDGWEVQVEEDETVLRRVHYTDWHRVERALSSVTREVLALEDTGWTTVVRR
jgi:hypothetical protein